jgi:hypothetical protein
MSWTQAVTTGELADPLCACCDQRPIPPAAFSILSPFVDRPEALSVSAICPTCAARSDGDLIEAISAVLRRDMFRDLRRMDPAHMHGAGGRA